MVADLEWLLARLTSEYIWIDVASIGQKRDHIEMEEVRRQASIFKISRQAYVWLNKHGPEALQRYLQPMNSCSLAFAQGGTDKVQSFEDILGSTQCGERSVVFVPSDSTRVRPAVNSHNTGQRTTASQYPWTMGQ